MSNADTSGRLGKGGPRWNEVLQLLEGPLTAYIAGGRSTCWHFAIQ